MFYRRQNLRFQCTGCGACCTGNPADYVAVDAREQQTIRVFLGVSRQWFRRRYLVKLDGDHKGLASRENGRCVFLDRANRCRIYAARPRQCRTYPFWPEVVHSRTAWQSEARRCEGIGRGRVIPLTRIEAALRACKS
jgi:Fe-S-cluster containining protein